MRHFTVTLFPLLICGALGCDSDASAPETCRGNEPIALTTLKVTIDGQQIRDANGRRLLLRGVNTGGRSKYAPFFPFAFAESGFAAQSGAPPFDDAVATYLDRVVSWGHNVIRMPFSWEALEPVRGSYDAGYLARYRAFAEAAGARDLRVIVDFHQDVFADRYCGDGFPAWAVSGTEPKPDAEACKTWFFGYLGNDAVNADFDRFWRNDDGLMDSFEAMWRHMAAELWTVDAVIGFEVINEPAPGTMDPAEWARDVLTAFHTRMVQVIREVAPTAPVFFDDTGTNALSGTTTQGLPAGGSLVFAPHYYDPAVIGFSQVPKDFDVIPPIRGWHDTAADWGVPVILGEFGVRPDIDDAATYLRANFEALDALLMHGTTWEYSSTVDDWNDEGMSLVDGQGHELATVVELIRVYPSATDGRVVSTAFNPESAAATVVLEVAADTIHGIVAPSRVYPDGVIIDTGSADACSAYDSARQVVRVHSHDAGTLTVSLSR